MLYIYIYDLVFTSLSFNQHPRKVRHTADLPEMAMEGEGEREREKEKIKNENDKDASPCVHKET